MSGVKMTIEGDWDGKENAWERDDLKGAKDYDTLSGEDWKRLGCHLLSFCSFILWRDF